MAKYLHAGIALRRGYYVSMWMGMMQTNVLLEGMFRILL